MLIVPFILLTTFIISLVKKINIYDNFIEGIKESFSLCINLLPYLMSVFMLIALLQASGISGILSKVLATPLEWFGIPKELCELMILRPISGSGSLGATEVIFQNYGVDSYISRCASVVMGCNDTIFYIVAVYFATSEDKSTGLAIPISIFASFIGAVFGCYICRFL